MPTTTTPVWTINSAANVTLSPVSPLGASGSTVGNIDLTTKVGGRAQIKTDGLAAIAATNGIRVDLLAHIGTGPVVDTLAAMSFVIPTIVGSTIKSCWLPSGKWQLKLTNLDATNSVAVTITLDTFDSLSTA